MFKSRDALKDKLIAAHQNDINHFVRIPYTTNLTKQSIRDILTQKGIIIHTQTKEI